MPNLIALPIDEAEIDLELALRAHRNLVIVAEPGAGKTTRFPPFLLRHLTSLGSKHQILMLEPRRIATRASAERIAEEQGWQVGREIGYQVRFENKIGPATRLQIVTEGLLAARVKQDSDLKDFSAVILDEFHERNLHSDVAIGLLKELQELSRPDLRIIVMSATIDAEKVAAYLGNAPIVRVPGALHPIEIHRANHPLILDTSRTFVSAVSETILRVAGGELPRSGDVLVFLPGAREIRQVRESIEPRLKQHKFSVFELFGSMSVNQQSLVLHRHSAEARVILATNLAETSLTIDGVGTVIDSGLERSAKLDALGFTRLEISRISRASAKQRMGRAGRQMPGHCYRLWNAIDEASMADFSTPEIFRSDLAATALLLLSLGVAPVTSFSWYEAPDENAVSAALARLKLLKFIDPEIKKITKDGALAARLPVSPPLAKLLLEAARISPQAVKNAANLAALLSERVGERELMRGAPRGQHQGTESDVLHRLHLMSERSSAFDDRALSNFFRVRDALHSATLAITSSISAKPAAWAKGLSDDEVILRLLLLAFPDRVARRRRSREPQARMVGGRGILLSRNSVVESADLFVALSASEERTNQPIAGDDPSIGVASQIHRDWLAEHFPNELTRVRETVWNPQTEAVETRIFEAYGDLRLEEPRMAPVDLNAAFSLLRAEAHSCWHDKFMREATGLKELYERIAFLSSNEGMRRELTTNDLHRACENAIGLTLDEACFNESRLAAVLAKPISQIFNRHLPVDLQKLLATAAPEMMQVPSGSQIRVNYPEGRPPFIEVRIQELFGWRDSPRLANGQVPLSFHLLSPAYQPVQITSDLESFWRNGYAEVRRELRLRYPKHAWPEDPLTAKPVAKGRSQRN